MIRKRRKRKEIVNEKEQEEKEIAAVEIKQGSKPR